MSMQEYRIFEFYSLVLPLMILFSTSVFAYVKIKLKYIELRARYEPDFRKTKNYRRYAAFKSLEEKIMKAFKVQEEAQQEED